MLGSTELRPSSPMTATAYPGTSVREPLSAARAHLVQTTDDAMDLLRWLSTKDRIALDTETTGLDHLRDHARLVQVGDAMDGWAIPVERNWMLVDDIVKRFQGTYDMHNAPYDWSMIKNGGIEIPTWKINDTRLMAHVLTSTGSLALKNLSQRHVDPRAASAQQILEEAMGRKGGWTWETIPVTFQPYWSYGCLDTILTYRLGEILEPEVLSTAPTSYQLEMSVTWVCERMARKGAAVDRGYTAKLELELRTYMDEVEQWCKTNYGIWPGSDAQVAEVLQRDGVKLTKRTPKTGMLSVDKEVLSALDHPLAGAVLERRRCEKLAGTYLTTFLDASQYDGRVHPSINTVGGRAKNPFEPGGMSGVRTGRMSMDSPNLQNVPIHTSAAKRIRNCFEPRCDDLCGCESDHDWLKFDFEQIEMRIFAHLAKDEGMIDTFRRGGDYFLNATRDIFENPTIVKSDERRQYVKNGHYAKLYAAGPERFAKTIKLFKQEWRQDRDGNWSLETVPNTEAGQAFLMKLDQKYPGIRKFQSEIDGVAKFRRRTEGSAYVRSPLTGRKHTADPGREYALVNYMIQGAAGEILKMKMLEADQAGLGPYMMLAVHDEIDLDVPHKLVEEIKVTLRDIMNDVELLSVPITSTMSIGKHWGDVEDV